MRIRTYDIWKRLKVTLFSGLTGGVVLASTCSVTDVRHNLVAGMQSFIRGYATDLLEAMIPPPDELISGSATP